MGLGLVALAEQVLGGSEKDPLVFSAWGLLPGPGGNSDSHRNGAGTFISGEQAGDESRQAGFWPRGFSKATLLESAGLPGS